MASIAAVNIHVRHLVRHALRAATIFVVFAAPAAAQAQSVQEPLKGAAWIAGCWVRRGATLVTEEQWMAPQAGTMLGMSRTTRDGKLAEYEFLRLFERDGRVVYNAMPSGQASTEFTSTQVADSALVFENPDHDFPQRIIYRRVGADSLVARIEGPGPNGVRGVDFRFARASCPRSSPR